MRWGRNAEYGFCFLHQGCVCQSGAQCVIPSCESSERSSLPLGCHQDRRCLAMYRRRVDVLEVLVMLKAERPGVDRSVKQGSSLPTAYSYKIATTFEVRNVCSYSRRQLRRVRVFGDVYVQVTPDHGSEDAQQLSSAAIRPLATAILLGYHLLSYTFYQPFYKIFVNLAFQLAFSPVTPSSPLPLPPNETPSSI